LRLHPRTRLLGLTTEIVGVQSTLAPSYALSFAAGTIVTTETSNTLADGMATRIPDSDALSIIRKGASRIVQVTDAEIAAAIRAYWTDTHNLAEGAGAAALAAALQDGAKNRGKRVGLILSGGNIDFDCFTDGSGWTSPWKPNDGWRCDGACTSNHIRSVMRGLDPRIHPASHNAFHQENGLPGHRRAEATPSFDGYARQ